MNLHFKYEMPLYPLHIIFNNIIWTKCKTEEPAVFIDSNLLQEMQLNISTNEIESECQKDTIINAVFLFHGQLYITSKP
jgi:hypothetical protein